MAPCAWGLTREAGPEGSGIGRRKLVIFTRETWGSLSLCRKSEEHRVEDGVYWEIVSDDFR